MKSRMNKVESIKLWENRIQSRKLSGMKVNEWCEKNNVSRDAYYYWHRRIKDSKEEVEPVFTEVLLKRESLPSVDKTSKAEIIISWKDFSISVSDRDALDITVELLRKLENIC
jgi:hypothetical protein